MDLNDLITQNAAFRGDELNAEKMNRLNAIRDGCRALAGLVYEIENPMIVFDNTCRNAAAKITMPRVFILENSEAKEILASLLSATDEVTFSAADGEHIAISFSVLNMWNAFHFDDA